MLLAEMLRDRVPGLRVQLHCGGGSFKSQFRSADRSGAKLALILGDDEMASDSVGAKPLRGGGEGQQVWAQDEAADRVAELIGLTT